MSIHHKYHLNLPKIPHNVIFIRFQSLANDKILPRLCPRRNRKREKGADDQARGHDLRLDNESLGHDASPRHLQRRQLQVRWHDQAQIHQVEPRAGQRPERPAAARQQQQGAATAAAAAPAESRDTQQIAIGAAAQRARAQRLVVSCRARLPAAAARQEGEKIIITIIDKSMKRENLVN